MTSFSNKIDYKISLLNSHKNNNLNKGCKFPLVETSIFQILCNAILNKLLKKRYRLE